MGKNRRLCWVSLGCLIGFSAAHAAPADRIDPLQISYLGAFLMPSGYGYSAMRIAVNPAGNNGNGSLFVVNGTDGHEGGSYGRFVVEVSIPSVKTGSASGLNRAGVLQARTSAISAASPEDTQGQPAFSLARGSQTSSKLYLPGYRFYNVTDSLFRSLGWIDTNLSSPNAAGAWNISAPGNMVNKTGGYAFFAPQSWADQHTGGRSLIVGFHRGFGNQSSNGPTMFATAPWTVGSHPPNNADIPATVLLRYPSVDSQGGGTVNNPVTNFQTNYSMATKARGAAWVEWGGKRAVVFVGTHGTQTNYCYGSSCSSAICPSFQGPNAPPYAPRFWWYDVDSFEAVAAGSLNPSDPVPYHEQGGMFTYHGQCAEFFQSAAFDDTKGILYVTEGFVPVGASHETVVHAYRIAGQTTTPSENRVVQVSSLTQLYAAFGNQQAGDEIIIAPGTYTLNSTALSVSAPGLTIRGSTGNRNDVVIRGDAMSADASIKSIFYFPQGANGQNATIKDMSIGRVGYHAVFFNGNGSGNGTTIDNVRIFDSWEQLVKAAVSNGVGTENVTVKNSLFEYTAGTGPQWYIGGIDAHHPNNWLVRKNEFRNIKSPSNSVAEHAVHLWSGSSFSGSNIVERNKITNCDRGIGIWNGTGTNVIRNNMVSSDGSGVFPDVGIDVQNTRNIRVYNNTVWIDSGGYYAAMEFRGATTTGALVVNNLTNKQIAVFSGASGTFQSNVSIAQSSWFVGAEAGDLHLANGVSSLVGQGQSVSGLVDDFDGTPRGASITIGAHQWLERTPQPPSGLRVVY